jgi:hypothetical protein
MAIYAQFDEAGPCIQIASNAGWSEFGDWSETLGDKSKITALFTTGECENIPGLRAELEAVLQKTPPDNKDVYSVADGIIHAIDAGGVAEILLVTAGVSVSKTGN